MNSDLKDKLIRIQRLAREGEGGERENAARQLARLIEKHGLTPEDLEEHRLSFHEFSYRTKYEKVILAHVALSNGVTHMSRPNGSGCKMWLHCTDIQAADIIAEYDVMRDLWRAAVDTLLTAFVNKHDLFAEDSEPSKQQLDPDALEQLMAMMAGLSDAPNLRPMLDWVEGDAKGSTG